MLQSSSQTLIRWLCVVLHINDQHLQLGRPAEGMLFLGSGVKMINIWPWHLEGLPELNCATDPKGHSNTGAHSAPSVRRKRT